MSTDAAYSQLIQLIFGFQKSQAIHVVARLGIADLLQNGAKSSTELARLTDTHPDALYRLLRAVTVIGVLDETSDQTFELTPLGQYLRSDVEGSRRATADYAGRDYVWGAWGDLMHSVRTGEPAFDHLHGSSIWKWRSGRPEENELFNQSMTDLSRMVVSAVVAACDFTNCSKIVDVGGGHGALMAGILRKNEHATGIVFDLPHVVAGAKGLLSAAGVAPRCEVVGGDYFTALPQGADAYIVMRVFHDVADADATRILRACRYAMTSPEARLIVVDRAVEENGRDVENTFSDLNMMVMTGGSERPVRQFTRLFEEAGFVLKERLATASPVSLLVCAPA